MQTFPSHAFSNGYDIGKPCMHFSMHLLPRMTWHERGERNGERMSD